METCSILSSRSAMDWARCRSTECKSSYMESYKSSSASSSAILPSSFVFWRSSFFRAACKASSSAFIASRLSVVPKEATIRSVKSRLRRAS